MAKTKIFTVVKKFTISIMMLLLAVPLVATGAKRDSLLISKVQSGDKVVERYLVRNAQSSSVQFEMMFPINSSNLQVSFANNAETIAALKRFAANAADTTMHLTSIEVVGYASPDGLESKNLTLATARAQVVADYISTHCKDYKLTTSAHAYLWTDCIPTVEGMDIDNKEEVIAILGSESHSEAEKQAELMKLPKTWMLFKTTILPPMRHAALKIAYTKDSVVEKTYTVKPPQPAPKPTPQPVAEAKPQPKEKPYPVAVVETDETGIIVEVPEKEHRHKRKNR